MQELSTQEMGMPPTPIREQELPETRMQKEIRITQEGERLQIRMWGQEMRVIRETEAEPLPDQAQEQVTTVTQEDKTAQTQVDRAAEWI